MYILLHNSFNLNPLDLLTKTKGFEYCHCDGFRPSDYISFNISFSRKAWYTYNQICMHCATYYINVSFKFV